MSGHNSTTRTEGPEYLFAILARDTECIAGPEGPNQRRFTVTAGSLVAVTEDSLTSTTEMVTVRRLRGDGTPGRATARVPRTRLHVP